MDTDYLSLLHTWGYLPPQRSHVVEEEAESGFLVLVRVLALEEGVFSLSMIWDTFALVIIFNSLVTKRIRQLVTIAIDIGITTRKNKKVDLEKEQG